VPDPIKVFVAVALAFMLWAFVGCGSKVPIDPRDEAGLAEWEANQCDTRANRVTLKVRVDPGVLGVEVWMYRRSGGERRLGLMTNDRDLNLSRTDLEPGGYFRLVVGRNVVETVWMDLLACDVGTLIIASPVNFSFYMGQDITKE
jgi:hypothetical protein